MDINADLLGVSVVFQDATRYTHLQQELLRSTQELETAYEEFQSANEELETTNEELQSTNEELETTNEELQSTNEELETMNEELQSSNEELQATNEELRDHTDELNRVNAFMESILTSLQMGMIVLNNRLSVQLWNGGAGNLWGLKAEEAGLGCVSWVNKHQVYSKLYCFISEKLAKLKKRPTITSTPFCFRTRLLIGAHPNSRQILQSNSLAGVFGVLDESVANSVVYCELKPSFASTQPLLNPTQLAAVPPRPIATHPCLKAAEIASIEDGDSRDSVEF
jgi:PAS domain-containing protein